MPSWSWAMMNLQMFVEPSTIPYGGGILVVTRHGVFRGITVGTQDPHSVLRTLVGNFARQVFRNGYLTVLSQITLVLLSCRFVYG